MTTKTKKILVIDDDKDILEAIKLTLEDEDFKVQTSGDIDILFEKGTSLPDLIVLDVLLSGKDGREISKTIKSNTLTKNIPVILVSADSAAKKNFSSSMASAFISKPFDIYEFVKLIKKHLGD